MVLQNFEGHNPSHLQRKRKGTLYQLVIQWIARNPVMFAAMSRASGPAYDKKLQHT